MSCSMQVSFLPLDILKEVLEVCLFQRIIIHFQSSLGVYDLALRYFGAICYFYHSLQSLLK